MALEEESQTRTFNQDFTLFLLNFLMIAGANISQKWWLWWCQAPCVHRWPTRQPLWTQGHHSPRLPPPPWLYSFFLTFANFCHYGCTPFSTQLLIITHPSRAKGIFTAYWHLYFMDFLPLNFKNFHLFFPWSTVVPYCLKTTWIFGWLFSNQPMSQSAAGLAKSLILMSKYWASAVSCKSNVKYSAVLPENQLEACLAFLPTSWASVVQLTWILFLLSVYFICFCLIK